LTILLKKLLIASSRISFVRQSGFAAKKIFYRVAGRRTLKAVMLANFEN